MSEEHEEAKCWICQGDRILKQIGPENLAILKRVTSSQKKIDSIFAMLEQAKREGISKENDNLTSEMMDQMACNEFIDFLKHAAAKMEEGT